MQLLSISLKDLVYDLENDPLIQWADPEYSQSLVTMMFDPLLVNLVDDKYHIVANHRLYHAAKNAEIEDVYCIVCGNSVVDIVKGYYVRLLPEGQISPFSRLLIIDILKKLGSVDQSQDCRLLGIAAPFNNDKIRKAFLKRFSFEMRTFLVNKKVPFKVMKLLADFPEEHAAFPDTVIKYNNLSASRFREILELGIALCRRDGTPGEYNCENADELYQDMYHLRYPEFSKRRAEAEELLKKLPDGVQAVLPAYFEGSAIDLHVKALRRDKGRKALESVGRIDADVLEKLLGFL